LFYLLYLLAVHFPLLLQFVSVFVLDLTLQLEILLGVVCSREIVACVYPRLGYVLGELFDPLLQVWRFSWFIQTLFWLFSLTLLVQVVLPQIICELIHGNLFRLCKVPLVGADVWSESTTQLVFGIGLELLVVSVVEEVFHRLIYDYHFSFSLHNSY